MRSKTKGVTLIELLIVIVIVSMLMAIAIPAYRNYVRRAGRADGKAALLAMAGQLERCFTRFNSYDPDDGCAVASGVVSTEGKYVINIISPTAVGYQLEAVPQAGQADDAECGTFTLDSANVKGVTGSAAGTPQRCWGK